MNVRTDVLADERDGRGDGLGHRRAVEEVLVLEDRRRRIRRGDRKGNDVARSDVAEDWQNR